MSQIRRTHDNILFADSAFCVPLLCFKDFAFLFEKHIKVSEHLTDVPGNYLVFLMLFSFVTAPAQMLKAMPVLKSKRYFFSQFFFLLLKLIDDRYNKKSLAQRG